MKKLLLATGNEGKVKELKELLKDMQIEILSLKDFPHLPEVVEDGDTFESNALKKAVEICEKTGLITLADDSGLEVDFLDGAPGIYSARFAGEPKDDLTNNQKLLKLLKDVPEEKRGAQFRCVIAVVTPMGQKKVFEGICRGVIIKEMLGEKGFGYDPLFYLPEYQKTFAQLDLDVKNKISHRGKAINKTITYIKDIFK